MKEFIGNIWTETEPAGTVRIGFSRGFIEQRLGECFHVMQADSKFLRKGSPLLVIETNDGLESLKSPISGTIMSFNPKARNFPDRLTEEDMILHVIPEGVKIVEKAKKPATAKPTAAEMLNMELFQRQVERLQEADGLAQAFQQQLRNRGR